MSTLLEAGHYDEVKQMLIFLSTHAGWNERNRCFHANMHCLRAGREIALRAGPNPRLRKSPNPASGFNQMNGPQLDAFGPITSMPRQILSALRAMKRLFDPSGPSSRESANRWRMTIDRFAETPIFFQNAGLLPVFMERMDGSKKYNPETGLIVDNWLGKRNTSGIFPDERADDCRAPCR